MKNEFNYRFDENLQPILSGYFFFIQEIANFVRFTEIHYSETGIENSQQKYFLVSEKHRNMCDIENHMTNVP